MRHNVFSYAAYTLHDRACTLASLLLYKAEMTSDRHADSSVVYAWIDVGLGLCRAVVSGM